jgi:hypothetical protein
MFSGELFADPQQPDVTDRREQVVYGVQVFCTASWWISLFLRLHRSVLLVGPRASRAQPLCRSGDRRIQCDDRSIPLRPRATRPRAQDCAQPCGQSRAECGPAARPQDRRGHTRTTSSGGRWFRCIFEYMNAAAKPPRTFASGLVAISATLRHKHRPFSSPATPFLLDLKLPHQPLDRFLRQP